jgi:hypothetical protein
VRRFWPSILFARLRDVHWLQRQWGRERRLRLSRGRSAAGMRARPLIALANPTRLNCD